MNNKIIFVIFFIVLFSTIPVFALENKTFDSMITINYTWTGNISTSTLRIIGESLDTTETLSNESWFRTFWIHPTREIGNSSDITSAFKILDVCLNQMNYTDAFVKCRDSNKDLNSKLFECQEGQNYETNFTACMGNLSLKDIVISDKEDEKSVLNTSWQKKYDGLYNQKFWFMLFTIAGGLYFLYDFIIVKKGRVNLKREERTNFPKEGAF